MTHTAGVPENFLEDLDDESPAEELVRMQARETAVLDILANAPQSKPGSSFKYSNMGYVIAGVIAEKITKQSWEALIRQEIFAPLNIHTGGFGTPKDSENELEQPRGHRKNFFGFTVTSDSENGLGILLKRQTYQHLHQPLLENYAYGWAIDSNKSWANGSIIWHNGSNGRWYALLALIPGQNNLMIVVSNDRNIPVAQIPHQY